MQEFPENPSRMDRRIRRTRHALQHALLRLIHEKGYDAISIHDICEAANVGRSTFYLHYTSKEDLKRAGLDHLKLQLMFEQGRDHTTGDKAYPLAFSLPMFRHAKEHVSLYRALLGSSGGAVALDTIREMISEFVRKDPHLPKSITLNPAAVALIEGGFMAVLTHWLDAGAVSDPLEINATFRQCILCGVASAAASD